MATCAYCGGQIPEGVKFCTECGAAVPIEATIEQPQAPQGFDQQAYQQPNQQAYQQPNQQPSFAAPVQQPVNDSGSIGWAILSFFIPIVGLVLFLVWNKTKPNCAKMAAIGAIIGVCINIAYMVFGGGLRAIIG